MSRKFASGKNAFGFCDRCSFRYKLGLLRKEFVNGVLQSLKVCPECWDKDHPQNRLGDQDYSDPQALKEPRTDTGLSASRDGDNIVYNFTNDLDSFEYTDFDDLLGPPAGTITHDSTNGWAIVNFVSTSGAPTFFRTGMSFLASDYTYIRVRLKVTTAPDSDFDGLMSWSRVSDGGSTSATREILPLNKPVLNQMGDQFTDIRWDLDGVANWDETIERLYFRLYAFDGAPFTGEVAVDKVEIEKSPS